MDHIFCTLNFHTELNDLKQTKTPIILYQQVLKMHRININMGPSTLCYQLIACLSKKQKKNKKKQQKQKLTNHGKLISANKTDQSHKQIKH